MLEPPEGTEDTLKSRPGTTPRRDQGRRLRRTLIVPIAGLLTIAAVAIPLAVHAGIEKRGDSSSARAPEHTQPVDVPAPTEESPATEATDAGGPIRFGQFPLDEGWAEIYGRNFINGPDAGAGGISMPEGHCNEEVLFASGYEDKLSTYVSTTQGSRTREILGYAQAAAARSTLRALGDAVANCAVFPYPGAVAYSAEVYESIDKANARTGMTTFTFAYTSTGADPFGVVYQFAVVADVLYGSNAYGDWTTRTASEGVADLNRENGSLIPLLSRIKR